MHKDTHHSGFSDTTFIFPFKNVIKMRSHVVMFLRVSHCFSVSLQKMRCCWHSIAETLLWVWIIYSFLFFNKWLMWLLFVCELKSSCEWLSCVSASSVFHDVTCMGMQTECTSESEGASHCVLLLDRRVRGWQCEATRINWTTPLIQSTVEWIQWNTAKLINHLAWLTLLLSSQLL